MNKLKNCKYLTPGKTKGCIRKEVGYYYYAMCFGIEKYLLTGNNIETVR